MRSAPARRGAGTPVIAMWFASVLAVAAIQDTTSLVPGTTVRFGAESGRFGAAQGFQPTPGQQPPDHQQRAGTMRFFGSDAAATLYFLDRRLVQADFVIENASPRLIGYIDDDLRRRGYRRECTVRERDRSRCTWTGEARVELQREGVRIAAVIRPLTREERRAGAAPAAGGAAPDSATGGLAMPMHPDTLELPSGWTREDFLVESPPAPEYPAAARDAGVQGAVRMLGLVDTSGAVVDVRITRGIPELDSTAVATFRATRFRPFIHDGRRVGAWVRVRLMFTLH